MNFVQHFSSSDGKVLSERIVVPGVHDLVVFYGSLNHGSPNPILASDQRSAGRKETLSCIHNRGDMAFIQRKNSPHVGYDDVGTDWNRNFGGDIFEEFDLVGTSVCCGDFSRELDDFIWLNRINATCAELAGQNCDNSRPGADIHDHGAWANHSAKSVAKPVDPNPVRDHQPIPGKAVCS